MSAVVCHGPRDYRLEEVPIPNAVPGEALVEVEAVGICASDLKCFNGAVKFWGDADRPPYVETKVIPGHEFVGAVIEIDEEASRSGGASCSATVSCPSRSCRAGVPLLPAGEYWMCAAHNIYGFKRVTQGVWRRTWCSPSSPSCTPCPRTSPPPTPPSPTALVFAPRRRARRDLVRGRRRRRRLRTDRARHDRRSGGQVAGRVVALDASPAGSTSPARRRHRDIDVATTTRSKPSRHDRGLWRRRLLRGRPATPRRRARV